MICSTKVLNFVGVYSLVAYVFGVMSKKLLPNPRL